MQAFHHDPAFGVRIQGGGCGLAHCGMLTRAQRMQAVPGLMTMVEDPQLDAETRKYVSRITELYGSGSPFARFGAPMKVSRSSEGVLTVTNTE